MDQERMVDTDDASIVMLLLWFGCLICFLYWAEKRATRETARRQANLEETFRQWHEDEKAEQDRSATRSLE
jgi:hypothetical protein